jgi:hypothetical protein
LWLLAVVMKGVWPQLPWRSRWASHSPSSVLANALKFDSDSVFEVNATHRLCDRLGVGVLYSAPYAHHLLGKAKRPLRTFRDNASAMIQRMCARNYYMCSSAVITVIYSSACATARSAARLTLRWGLPYPHDLG